MFRQISVKQKFHRAHATFDLERYLFLLSIPGITDSIQDIGQKTLANWILPAAPLRQMLFPEYRLFEIP